MLSDLLSDLTFTDWLWIALGATGAGLLLALLLAMVILRRIRVEVPEGAGFFDTLRATPLIVVIFLDVLDFFFDLFGAPVAWYVLGRVGLGKLRGAAVLEALLPFTQPIPTMTLCWVLGKLLGRSRAQLLESAAHHAKARKALSPSNG